MSLGAGALCTWRSTAGESRLHNALAPKPLAVDFDVHECRSVYTHPDVAVAGLTRQIANRVRDIVNAPHLHPTMAEIITYPALGPSRRLSVS
jgi:hypothetical protein